MSLLRSMLVGVLALALIGCTTTRAELQAVEYSEVEYIDTRVLTLSGSLMGLLKGVTVAAGTAAVLAVATVFIFTLTLFR